ncbi:hypothetical protein LIER_29922 [Lithospermum erythrorhizon]|uniref:Dynein light chain n=1 Tax=Lithospermum erythrorhizon TaxID=34254 RepID=A0AAV3RMD1_LITER
MSTYEKPRKGGMYVYNIATGGKMKAAATTPSPQPTLMKSISKGWGQLTRSRTYREEIDDGGDELIKNRVEEKKMVVDHGRKSLASSGTSRKSVSQIQEVKMVEGRKSVCSISELKSSRNSVSNVVEVVNVASMAAIFQVKVLVTDMPGFMQVHAFKCARKTFDSLEKFSSRDMACTIKKVSPLLVIIFHSSI